MGEQELMHPIWGGEYNYKELNTKYTKKKGFRNFVINWLSSILFVLTTNSIHADEPFELYQKDILITLFVEMQQRNNAAKHKQ